MTDTERAIRAATCGLCKCSPLSLVRNGGHYANGNGESFIGPCSYNPGLLPLFQAATEQARKRAAAAFEHYESIDVANLNLQLAGAYAAAAKAVDASRDKIGRIMHESWTRTKRAQGFHRMDSTTLCPKCHADLVDWDELPQKQKDINLHAFDDVLPVLTEAILKLTPADARQASQHGYTAGRAAITYIQYLADQGLGGARDFIRNLATLPPMEVEQHAAIASAEARARLEEGMWWKQFAFVGHRSSCSFESSDGPAGDICTCDRTQRRRQIERRTADLVQAAARTPDSTRPLHTQVGIDGICCSCSYSGEEETPCLKQEDGHHCIHWYEGESPDSTKEQG